MADELDDLKNRIRQAKGEDKAEAPPESPESTNTAIRAVTDLIGTPIVAGGVGIGLDKWFETSPVFFILLAFLGVCAGFWNLARMMSGNDSSVGFKRLQNKEKEGNKAQLSRKETDT
jgi:ATP synthase protein I